MTENTAPSGSNDLPGIAAIAVPSPLPGKASDHELTGRLSRAGFAKILWSALEEVPPARRAELSDAWSEQLMRRAKLRNITWWPSLASATTASQFATSDVQTALEQVLDATPSPHRRAKEEQDDDSALAAALRCEQRTHSPAGRDVTSPPRPAVSTAAAPEGEGSPATPPAILRRGGLRRRRHQEPPTLVPLSPPAHGGKASRDRRSVRVPSRPCRPPRSRPRHDRPYGSPRPGRRD